MPAAEQRDRAQRAGHGGAARHVVLHPLHAIGRLDRDAARVERDALAHEAEYRRRWRARRIVPDDDETRRLGAALRHAEKQPHPQLARAGARRAHRRRDPPPTPRSSTRREFTRRQHVARLVREAAREVHGLADDAALAHLFADGAGIAARHDDVNSRPDTDPLRRHRSCTRPNRTQRPTTRRRARRGSSPRASTAIDVADRRLATYPHVLAMRRMRSASRSARFPPPTNTTRRVAPSAGRGGQRFAELRVKLTRRLARARSSPSVAASSAGTILEPVRSP